MDTEILKQLVWIKWLLVVTTILIGLFVALIAVMAKGFIRHVENNLRHHSFQELAKGLLDIGKAEDVLALAELRAKEYPADPQAFWYMAQASYRLEKYDRALFSLKKAQELEPSSEETHIAPFKRAIEEKLRSFSNNQG